MQIIIKGKQVPVTSQLREKIERKAQRLAHYIGEEGRVEVTIAEEKTRSMRDRFSVQVALSGESSSIHSEVSAQNVPTALDMVLDKVVAQLGKQKKRLNTVRRHQTPGVKVMALARTGEIAEIEEVEGEERVDEVLESERNEEIWSQVVEIRSLPARGMSDREVIEQMEGSGATFLPFFNEETKSVNVMYRLEQGGYGLLVPATE
jgi:putative sigma-54 modulation protein